MAAGGRERRVRARGARGLSAARIARLAAGCGRDAAARDGQDEGDLRELAAAIRRAACYTRTDLEAIAALAQEKNLWVISDEAYEDVVFEGEQISIASLPGMYERTIPLYTFSKTYAITGLRLGYIAVQDPTIRERVRKMLFYTVSNTSSLVQYGGVGALTGSQSGDRGLLHGTARSARVVLCTACATRRRACSAARRRPARSMRFSGSIRRGARRCPMRRRRSRGR